jgi:hypothetical protein
MAERRIAALVRETRPSAAPSARSLWQLPTGQPASNGHGALSGLLGETKPFKVCDRPPPAAGGFDQGLGQFLDKQRNTIGPGDDLFQNLRR